IYVINTCSVTENADKECRQLVRRIQRLAPESFVVITGCYAQLKPKEIAEIPGVDLVLGASEKFNLVPHLANLTKGDATKICSCDIDTVTDFKSSYSVNDRTRTFLKVQDGCDYSCTFCTIPMARGKSRSDRIENVVADAQTLASKGVKEIVLTGINLGDFGKSEEGGKKHTENFFDLLKALEQETNMPRYRISSIEPNLLTNEIIEFVTKSKRIMPHFHIPLQSGSDAVLKLMQRRYTRDLYQERVDLIKKIMPHACIGVDVIVGSPGETEDYFKESLEFVHALDIAYLHVFTYSERAATKALTIKPIVPMQERHERNKILRNLSYQKLQYFTESQRGATRKVLFESPKVNKENEGMLMLEGFTDNYIKVETPHRAEWSNQIIDWKLL
ncbi:MAG: tRNA ((6)-L-threonylcarbamoyladenosine(37)-C(2))-methylthiotransferase MtaB, partial [Bacteroidota bacterium]